MGDYMFHISIIRFVPLEQINFLFSSEPQLKETQCKFLQNDVYSMGNLHNHTCDTLTFPAYQQLLSETQNFAHEAGLSWGSSDNAWLVSGCLSCEKCYSYRFRCPKRVFVYLQKCIFPTQITSKKKSFEFENNFCLIIYLQCQKTKKLQLDEQFADYFTERRLQIHHIIIRACS